MQDSIALHSRSLAKDGAHRAEVASICAGPLIDYSGASWREWEALALVADECAHLTAQNDGSLSASSPLVDPQ